MPLIEKCEVEGEGLLGIWQVTEPDEFYLEKIHLFPQEKLELAELSSRKKTEWLASRFLLHELSGRLDRTPCLKDQHGKPYLQDSDYHISMSHSNDRVAVMASKKSCGIDIQKIVNKITRIAAKFCAPDELKYIDQDHTIDYLHIIWGAKECMYKSYGKRNLDLRKNLAVDSFVLQNMESINTVGHLSLPDYYRHYNIYGKIKNNYVLVYAIDNTDSIDFSNKL